MLKGKGTRQTKKKCVKATAFSCKFTCLPKERDGKRLICANLIIGNAKIALSWLKLHSKRSEIRRSQGQKAEPKRTIADITLERANTDYKNLRKEYLKDQGTFKDGKLVGITLNTDDWRGLFPEYRGTNAADVHEASSTLNKRLYAEGLLSMKGKGNNTVIVLAGGGGSGKGTAVKGHLDLEGYPLRLDQVSDDHSKLIAKINEARANGFDAEYLFVDRDPRDAWNGVVNRAIEGRNSGGLARTVPLSVAVKANLESRNTAIKVLEENLDIPAQVVDNNRGFGKARLIEDREEAIAFLKNQSHDERKLLKELENETYGLYEQGKIPLDIAIGLIGERSIQDRRIQSRPINGIQSTRQRSRRRTERDSRRITGKGSLSREIEEPD